MKQTLLLALAILGLSACQSATEAPLAMVEADPAVRAPMWEALSSLEGRWVSKTPYGEGEHTFEVSSAGSALREIMGPGTEHEMTNMYTLDGNSVLMVHYCGAGNQPRMRAASLEGDRFVFESVSVGDLKAEDEHYMGAMTLVIVDEDHVEQHWTSIAGGEVTEMGVFALERVK